MRTIDIFSVIGAILLCEAAGGIGSIAMVSSLPDWYTTLNKPPFNPPGWVFGPVWTALSALMGVAAWMVWNKGIDNQAVRTGLILFAVQLVLNMLWSFVFFYFKQPGWAFVEIVALWIAILLTMVWFFRVSTTAGILLIPYILWVSFASVLNFSLWWLNRG
jgi:translocator protein